MRSRKAGQQQHLQQHLQQHPKGTKSKGFRLPLLLLAGCCGSFLAVLAAMWVRGIPSRTTAAGASEAHMSAEAVPQARRPRLSQPLGCVPHDGRPNCTADEDAFLWMRHELWQAPILGPFGDIRTRRDAFLAATGSTRTAWRYQGAEALRRIELDNVPLLRHVLSQPGLVPRDGLWLEFGVWTAYSLAVIASYAPRGKTVFGFDSFRGLPEAYDTFLPAGAFSLEGLAPPVPQNVELVAGWFNETLLPFLAAHEGEPVAFAHIDCNLLTSVSDVLSLLAPRLAPGAVLLFDELAKTTPQQPRHLINFRAVYDLLLDRRLPPLEWVGRGKSSETEEAALRVQDS